MLNTTDDNDGKGTAVTHRSVRDVMTRDVITVGEDAAYKTVADLLAVRGISAVPVMDGAGHVVGIASEADLLPKVEFEGGAEPAPILRRHRKAYERATGTTAGEVMTSPAVTVGPDASVVEAARLMDRARVKRLPVVEPDGQLIGIVSRRDLLSVFLQPDEGIRDEILNDVFRRVLWVQPPQVSVEVNDGVVTLAGELEQKSLAEIAVRLCRAVDGVVDVVDHLRYRLDDTKVHIDNPLLGRI
jgi:CBS-domain-containing membrane protein